MVQVWLQGGCLLGWFLLIPVWETRFLEARHWGGIGQSDVSRMIPLAVGLTRSHFELQKKVVADMDTHQGDPNLAM